MRVRLTLTNAKSRRGVIYPYFMCTGRHARRTNCERKSMFVPDIEAAVEDYYRHVQIPEHVVTALRELVTSEFDRLHQVAKHEAQGYKAERDALRDERTKLMQAHYARSRAPRPARHRAGPHRGGGGGDETTKPKAKDRARRSFVVTCKGP